MRAHEAAVATVQARFRKDSFGVVSKELTDRLAFMLEATHQGIAARNEVQSSRRCEALETQVRGLPTGCAREDGCRLARWLTVLPNSTPLPLVDRTGRCENLPDTTYEQVLRFLAD